VPAGRRVLRLARARRARADTSPEGLGALFDRGILACRLPALEADELRLILARLRIRGGLTLLDRLLRLLVAGRQRRRQPGAVDALLPLALAGFDAKQLLIEAAILCGRKRVRAADLAVLELGPGLLLVAFPSFPYSSRC
jgi:hypothetical protein